MKNFIPNRYRNYLPLEPNGGLPVNIQDQTTPLSSALFAQSSGEFTLAADTIKSTDVVLNRNFTAAVGHNISIGEYVLLLDRIANKSLHAQVTDVTVNDIEIDRPIDHVYPFAGALPALGRKTIIDLGVNGSSTAQIFTVRAGAIPRDYYFWRLLSEHSAATDGTKFLGLNALTNGLLVRIYDGSQETLFNFKRDADVELYGGTYKTIQKSGGGNYITTYSIPIHEKYGVALRIRDLDVIQCITQDDLSVAGIITINTSIGGHITEGENG